MKLTGKCKEDFEKWFYINDEVKKSMTQFSGLTLYAFTQLPNSMQYGVYVDFFEFKDENRRNTCMELVVHKRPLKNIFDASVYVGDLEHKCNKKGHKTRQESRINVVKKANELYNNSLLK